MAKGDDDRVPEKSVLTLELELRSQGDLGAGPGKSRAFGQ